MSTPRSSFVWLALALGAAAPALAKPVYLTVPRAYGTHESPVVDLAFAEKTPVELRILKPLDLSAFITRQFNLRRAYEPPSTTANPGRALARGLNGLKSPGELLLQALAPDFRQALAPELPAREPVPTVALSRLDEGPERLIGIPDGLSLVRTEYLNLDLGGANRDFTVPGFEDSGWAAGGGESGYQERRLSLAPLPAGLYVLQLVQGVIEGQVVLVVSDLTAQVKQTDGEVLVRVANRALAPQPGAEVVVHLPSGATKSAKTDEKGEARLEVKEPRVVVTVTAAQDTAVVDTDFYSTLAISPDVFIYTDRPIYRPCDVVRFRGVVRQPDGFLARLLRPRNPTVEVKLTPDEGRTVTTRATVGELGTFSGECAVPAELGTVVVRVSARLDAQSYQAETRVQEYVKPTFYLELLSADETVTPGQELSLKVRARRYAGGTPKDTGYEVFLYRSQLDAPTWVDDSGRGGKGSQVTYGSASTTEGELSVPQRLYSSVQARGAQSTDDAWASAPKLDAQGEAEVKVQVPAVTEADLVKPWRYTLSIRARDDQGTFANGAQTFFLSDTDLLAAVKAKQKLVRPGDTATFAVRATTLSGKPYGKTSGKLSVRLLTPSGGSDSVLEQDLTTDETGVFRAEVKAPGPGVLEAQLTLQSRKGVSWSGTDSTLVIGAGGEAVVRVPSMVLESADQVVEPGHTAELVGLLPEGWGAREKNEGSLWVTLTGSGLFSTQLIQVKGTSLVHRFDVEKRFGSAVYASVAYPTSSGRWEERTVPFRIVPRERVLLVTVTPQREEAAPLTEQTVDLRVTDALGNGVASEVSVDVVDKAIYALQAEFRPGILDFFYPVGRNNVTTFSSSEFQGLGYGDRLARLLGQLPHQAFAAVKPPQKPQREQDTAYWNPSVMTDRDGRARVTFKLPSNQTLWTVTAVAADAAGRFGESTAEFATRGVLNVATSLPQFLRQGDVAQGSVRASLGAKAKREGTLEVKVSLGGALVAGEASQALGLKAKDEQLVPITLKAGAPGEALVTVSGTGIGEPLRDTRRFDVAPAAVEETVTVSRRGSGSLTLELPKGATVVSSRLSVTPSLLGAAMENLRELLAYPYGCVEQLVSTTVPNLAVYRTLEKANALTRLEPDAQVLMAEARSRAVQGTQRILQAAVKGGGFAWYSGYSEPSAPMTLVALDGLAWSIEAGLLSKDDPRVVEAAAWLEKQELPMPLAAQRVYVLSKLQGKKQAANVRNLLAGNAGIDVYGFAVAVLAAEEAGVDQEPDVKGRLQELAVQASAASFAPAVWQGSEWAWRYPLRRVGYTAVLGHAGSKAEGLDEAKARARALELLNEPGLSTFDRSTALLHSQWLLERELKDFKKSAPPSLEAGGARLEPSAGAFVASIPSEVREVKVGDTDAATTWRVRVRTPLAEVEPKANGMSLGRRYFALRGDQRVELARGDSVVQGEDVYVELEVSAHTADRSKWWHQSAYYVIEDAVPAGFTALQEDKAYRGAPLSLPLTHENLRRRVLSPQRVTWLFEEPAWWSDSPRVIGYVLRAQFAGTFSAPPARVEDMYAADLFARTAPATLSVRPSGAGR